MAINRIYVEKRPEHAVEAGSVLSDLRSVQGISTLRGVRIFNRYDVEGIDEALFGRCLPVVFSDEPAHTAPGQTIIGSLAPVTATAGLLAADYAILELLKTTK